MSFHLRRYWNGINKRASWLWVVFFPPLIYLAFVLANPHSVIVVRTVEIDPESPVTRAPGAISAIPVRRLVEQRDLFEDEQTYWTLKSRLEQEFPKAFVAGIPLWSLLHDDLAMQFAEGNRLEVRYRGSHQRLGEFLVDFFAQRLLARTREGRLVAANESAGRLEDANIRIDAAPAEITGDILITRQRTLTGHGGTVAVLFLVSLGVTILVLGALEWADPSFKSERQVARYLGIPVLGSLPDLAKVLDQLDRP